MVFTGQRNAKRNGKRIWSGNAVTSKLVHFQLLSSLQKLVKGREEAEEEAEEEEDFMRLFNMMILYCKKKHFRVELWLFPVICRLISVCLASNSRIYEVGLFCGTKMPPPNTSYIPYFTEDMRVLSELVNAHHWGHHAVNAAVPVYGLAQCHGDLSLDDCLLCFAICRTRLPHCLPAVSGRLYLDGCFLRYDDYNFFNESTDPARDKVNCSSTVASVGGAAEARKAEFNSSVGELLENVTKSAVSKGGFAVGEVKGVYGLAQCWGTLSSDGCRACLEKAADEVRGCLPSSEGRGLNAGCFLRYSTTKFYNDGSQKSSGSKTGAITAIVLGATAFVMFSFFAGYACYVRFKRLKQERNNLGQISASFSRSGLKFKYETLEKATDYFNPSKKLGQGGAGSVFKGTLPSGENVAVKRLFFSTRQWVDEFFNEVNLISGIQHKNLVKLLGCSIEGPESLLVYEYVPNKSLDQSLFDKVNAPSLSWTQRVDIIVGTAEGLAFLHGGSEIRIIHRDIKSSNVLLDENFAPKIADFGLARCFGPDMSHISTGIAGTLGYMAPEYLVRGQLTEKADVYSYGVLVLEIVCGRKNNAFLEDNSSLLQTVWLLYKTGRLAECVDPRLKNDFPAGEASCVLQVGLLCTQASAALRPSMAEVVRMLTIRDSEIPAPNQPPFLNASVLNAAGSTGTFSLNRLISSALLRIEEPSTSTESSSLPSSDDRSRSVELSLRPK